MLALFNMDPDVLGFMAVVFAGVAAVLHVLLAMGVMFDAVALERKRRLWFLGSLSWAAATLMTGLVGATAYWLMHRSTLAGEALPESQDRRRAAESTEPL